MSEPPEAEGAVAPLSSEPLVAIAHDNDDDDDHGLRPILECVVRHSSSSYTAYFGFKNEADQSISIPVGSSNAFSPAPQNRNQPTTFPKGRSPYYPNAAFSVPFNGSNLTWTLRGPGHHTRSVTAKASSPRCQAPPSPTPTPTATPTPIPTPTPPLVCASPVYGPTRFTRTCDDHGPTVYNRTFALPAGASGPFTLRVRNGDTQGRNKATAAEVNINGVAIVGDSDFSNNVVTFTKTIATLAATNQLYVKVKGAPGSTFTIEICGANQGDAIPPAVDWLTPLEGEILRDPAPLYRVRYSDAGSGLALSTLKILVDGVDQTAAFNPQPDEASYDSTAPLADGTHTLRAEIKDVAGNSGAATRTFRVDATDPVVAVAEPASGSLTRAVRPQIRLTFADGGTLPSGVDAATLSVSIDGVDVTSAFSVSGGVAMGTAPQPLANGSHRIDASISDHVGNQGTGFTLFTIDTLAPTVTPISPAQGQTFGASSVPVLVQYADNHALNLASFTATLDGAPFGLTVDADSASGTAVDLADGPHTLALSIADQAGNVKSSTVSFTTDTGKPEIFIVPANGQAINSRNPEIVVTYSDAQGVAPGTLKITVNGVVRTAEFTQTGSEARATLGDPLPVGLNVVAAEVRDGASNLGATTATFTVDVTPPVITVVSPAGNTFLNDTTPDIEITLQDEATGIAAEVTRVFIDGNDVTADFALGATGARGTPSTPLAEGPHTLEILAADGAANPATLTTTFYIDLTPPALDFASPRVDGFTNDPTPEIWLRLTDPQGPSGQTAAGIDLASARVYVLSEDPGQPDADITSLLTPTAVDIGLRGELVVALGDGSHRLRATARDAAGNESSLTVGFVVDTEAPTVVIDQPQSNTFLNSAEPTIVLLYNDTRSGVAPDLIQVTVDGIERAASLVPAPGGATLTLSRSQGFDLADGPHQVDARVVDLAGNATDAIPVTFGVDTVAPVAAVQAPVAQSFTGSPTPAIQFTLTDAAPSSGINPDFAKVAIDGGDITAGVTFTTAGGATEPVVVTGVGAVATPLGDGLHTLRITGIDNANNPTEISLQFTVDNGAPVITSEIPEEGRLIGGSALSNGRATITGTVVDLDTNLNVSCFTGAGQGVVTLASSDYTCVVPVAEGLNTVVVTASDSTSHTSSLSRPLTLDQTAPVISVSAPTDGAFTAATSLSVNGTVIDQSAITVTVNGSSAAVNAGTGGGPSTFEAAGVAVGAGPSVVLDVVATDAAGNASTVHVTVRVDRNAPIVAITSPSSGAYLRGGVTTVTADVTDETTTILDLNGVPGTKTGCVDLTAETRRCSFTAEVPLIAGNTTLVATAFDEAGNRGVNQVSAIVDNTPPAISVTTPGPGLTTNAVSISVAGTATDASPLTLTINGQNVATDGDGSFSATITSDVLGVAFASIEGATNLVFTATDAAGNTSSTTVSITFDRKAPALSIASPLSGAVVPNSSLSVSGTVADATPVSVFVQGVAAQVTGQAYSHTLADLSDGALTVTVRAVDAAGNEATLTREVEIDLGPPTVAITSPAAGALVREAFATLAYTVADRSRTTVTINGAAAPDCPGVVPCDRTQQVSLVDGDNTFTIEATDAGGRATSAQVTVTRDSIRPTLDLQTPATVSRGRAAAASASATDNLAVERVEIRLGSAVLCTGSTSCLSPIVIPEGASPGDSLTITAEATDRAGNTTTTSRTVRVTTDGVVTGTVLNDLTSLPVAGATVTLLSGNPRSATTDSNGRFNIPVAEAFATLRITKTGMTSVDRVVSVASGSGTVPIDARLTPLANTTSHSPVIPATNPPATVPPSSVTPAEAGVHGVPGPLSLALPSGSHRITLLSQQGLPNLLPPGFSPLAAFVWTSDAPGGTATASFALPVGAATVPASTLVRYDAGMRDWRIVATSLVATDGLLTTDIPGAGSYALIVPDTTTPAMTIGAPGEALVGLPVVSIPATATSESRVDPAVLPPTGGTATGSMRLDSPSALPSGTIVQAEVEESYTLTSGEEASAAKRSIDVVTFKRKALATSWGTGANAGSIAGATTSTACTSETPAAPGEGAVEHLCASFPITPSRTYGNAALKEGRVHLDLLAGRENARGTVGGNAATTITDGTVQLNVAAGSLDEDTAIAFFAYDTFSSFIPSTNGITPLGEVTVDLGSSTLNTSASLTFHNVAAAPGDTLVVARVDRAEFDGIPRLQVVALADVVMAQGQAGAPANGETSAVSRVDTGLPGLVLDGIKIEGRYTLLRLAGPVGWLKGLTTAGGSPVRALVSTSTLPFFATSSGTGAFAIPAAPGAVTLTARVLGQSLVGSASAVAIEGTLVTADIALQGTVSQASVVPVSGSVGVEVNEPFTLTSPVALNPNTVIPANISLRRVPPQRCAEPDPPASLNCAATQIPLRLVLSGSGKQLSIVPTAPVTVPATPALEFSTDYRLEVTGLLDTVGGLVTAPTIDFRTKADVKPVYDLAAITFSLPDQDGMVSVSAPNGTLPPGTTILIINGGNGVVVGLTAGNDGQVTGKLPASIDDQLFVTVTDPFGNTTTFTRSEFVAADGATGIGPGGGTVKARCLSPATPERDATECAKSAIQIPEGALDKGVTLKATVLTPEDYDAAHPNQRPDFGTLAQVIRLEASRAAEFNKEGDVTFAVPTLPAGVAPRDAFYYVLQRVERGQKPDGTPDYGFQVIDHAFVTCPGETPGYPATPPVTCDPSEQRVTTASFPFPGLLAAGLIVVAGAMLYRTYADLALIYAVSPLALGRSPKGVVSGTVRRQVWEGPENGVKKLVYKNVAGAEVSGFDSDGVTPLMTKDGGLSVVTGKDGSFAFWDDSFSGGTVKVIVKTKTETKEVLAVESASADLTGLRHYDRAAIVNVTLDPEALPPAIPDVEVVLLKAEDRADLKGITLAGTPVLIAFKNNRKDTGFLIQGVNVGGTQFAVIADPQGRYEAIQQPGTPFVPAVPGTFTVEATALDALGIPTPVRAAFRALAPGGGIDTDNNAAPAVMASRTTPRNNAFGVAVTVLPSVAFTEPVTRIAGNVTLKAITSTGAEDVPIKISGITAQNGVIDDLGANPGAVVTAVTILPLAGLLFGTKYTLSLGAGIEDLDKDATNQPSPKNLTPYSTSFTTFGPETITPAATGDFGARGMYVFGQKAYVLKHQISGYVWNGIINRYDISDPSEPKDDGVQAILQGRPSHLVGEEASVAAVAGTSFKPLPSTAHLYGINGEGGLEENALISFANGGSEGNVERLVLKGEKLYAATFRKGLQVADLVQARQAYVPCCSADYFRMVAASNTDGQGFGGEVVSTIPVPSSSATGLSWFTGLAVTDGGDPLILATGDFGLAVAQEAGGLKWKGQPAYTGGAEALVSAYGLAVAVGLDGSAPLAYVVTSAQDGGNAILFIVNLQNPASPVVLGATRLKAPRGVASILIKDGKAYIDYMEVTDQASLTEIVSVENPARPQYAGQIQGIGGHLSITADGLLLGVAHSALGTKPLKGGVQVAALDVTPLIRPLSPEPFGVDHLDRSQVAVDMKFGVASGGVEIEGARAELLRSGEVVEDVPLIRAGSTWTARFEKGKVFSPSLDYYLRFTVNPGPEQKVSQLKRVRAAQLEFTLTSESDDDERLDLLRLFNPTPSLSVEPIQLGAGRRFPTSIKGEVRSVLNPITNVAVSGRAYPVIQTSTGTGGMGPFVGTFNVPIELGPEATRVVVHALNALGNLGSYQVTIKPTVSDGLVVGRTVTSAGAMSPSQADAAPYQFRIQLRDRGISASTLDVVVDTGVEQKTVKLQGSNGLFVSPPLLAVPENLALPPSSPEALKSAFLRVKLGVKPKILYATNVHEEGAIVGALLIDSDSGLPVDAANPSDTTAVRSRLGIRVGASGTAGPQMSVSIAGLREDLGLASGSSSAPFVQEISLQRQSADPKSPGFNLYLSSEPIAPVVGAGVPDRSGVREVGAVPGAFIRLSAATGDSYEPIGIPADQAAWLVEQITPVFQPGEERPRFFDVVVSAAVSAAQAAVPALPLDMFFDLRTDPVDDISSITSVVPAGEDYVVADGMQTNDDGRVYLKVRLDVRASGASGRYKALGLQTIDTAGASVVALLKALASGTPVPLAVQNALRRAGESPLLAPFSSGRTGASLPQSVEALMGLIIREQYEPTIRDLAGFGGFVDQVQAQYAQAGTALSRARAEELTVNLLVGFGLAVPLGASQAALDDLNVIGQVRDLSMLAYYAFIGSVALTRVKWRIQEGVIRFVADPAFRADLIQRYNSGAEAIPKIIAALANREVLTALGVRAMAGIYDSYEAKVAAYLPSLGILRDNEDERTFIMGFAAGHITGYVTEMAATFVVAVPTGIGLAAAGMMKVGRIGKAARALAILRKLRVAELRAVGETTTIAADVLDWFHFLQRIPDGKLVNILSDPALNGKEEIVFGAIMEYADDSDEILDGQRVVPGIVKLGEALGNADEPAETLLTLARLWEHPRLSSVGASSPGITFSLDVSEFAIKGVDRLAKAVREGELSRGFLDRVISALDSGGADTALRKIHNTVDAFDGNLNRSLALEYFFKALSGDQWDGATFAQLERLAQRWATALPPPAADEAFFDIVVTIGKYGRNAEARAPGTAADKAVAASAATARIVQQLDRITDDAGDVVKQLMLLDKTYGRDGTVYAAVTKVDLDWLARNMEAGRFVGETARTPTAIVEEITRISRITGEYDDVPNISVGGAIWRQMQTAATEGPNGHLIGVLKGALANMEVGDSLRAAGAAGVTSEVGVSASAIDTLGTVPDGVTVPFRVVQLIDDQLVVSRGVGLPAGGFAIETKCYILSSWSGDFAKVRQQVGNGFETVDPLRQRKGTSWVATTPEILADADVLRGLLAAVNDQGPGWSNRTAVMILDRPSEGSGSYANFAAAVIRALVQ